MAANGLLGWLYLGERDALTEARSEASQKVQEMAGARGAAQACSTRVDELLTLAGKRAQEAEAARLADSAKATTHNRRADEILAAPPAVPAVPGDACASAQARIDGGIKGRAQP